MATFPILWVGPAGSGKLTAARKALGATGEPRLQTLEIGEYSARFWEFPTHMEVDIMDLSMMDKQILPEILNKLLSTRDVMGSGRKVMILRRIHGLSPPAAVRLRVCLEELVWSAGAPAMIWCTARTVNSAVAGVMDGFVYRRVPGPLEPRLGGRCGGPQYPDLHCRDAAADDCCTGRRAADSCCRHLDSRTHL